MLDKILEFYGVAIGGEDTLDTFVAVFDKIDADGGGEIDQEEMYDTLVKAGLDITEEGVITLVNMIDEDGNGKWRSLGGTLSGDSYAHQILNLLMRHLR